MIWKKEVLFDNRWKVISLKISHLISPITQFILNGRYPERVQHVTARQQLNQRALEYHPLSQYGSVANLM